MKLILEVRKSNSAVARFEVESGQSVTLGRLPENDIVLDDVNVSRYHCRISPAGDGWVISDLGSTNGILVNEIKVAEKRLESGDEMLIRPFIIAVMLLSEPGVGEHTVVADSHELTDVADRTIVSPLLDAVEPVAVDEPEGETIVREIVQPRNFVLIQEGPLAGVSISFSSRLSIGREEKADVSLADPGVSRQHAIIEQDRGRWRVRNLNPQNKTLVNGKPASKRSLKDGDIIEVGSTKLKLKLEKPLRSGGRASLLKSPLVRIAGALLLVFMLAIVLLVVLRRSSAKPEESSTGLSVEKTATNQESLKSSAVVAGLSLEHQRQRSLFLHQARQFIAEKNYNLAINRLEAAREIAPDDPEIDRLLTESSKAVTAGQRKVEEHNRRLAVLQEACRRGLAEARKEYDAGQYDRALKAIGDLPAEADSFSELDDLLSQARDLKIKVDSALKVMRVRQASESKERAEQEEVITRNYQAGLAAFRQGDYPTAMDAWENAAAGKVECDARHQASSRIPDLKRLLQTKVDEDYRKGLTLYKKKSYGKALFHWHRVLQIYPGHLQARERYEKLLTKVAEKARRLYQEGLVYEGISNIKVACGKWRKTLQVMPIEDNEYHIKAASKLKEYR